MNSLVVFCCVLSFMFTSTDAFKPLSRSIITTVSSKQSRPTFNFNKLFCERSAAQKEREEGQYFESEFDRTPLKERLPLAFGFLAFVSLPFIVGLVYLYSNK